MSDESTPLNESSNEVEEQELAPLFPKKGPVTELVLEEWGIGDGENDTVIVSFKVETLTVEAKVGDQNYGTARGYWELKPVGLHVHVPVAGAGKMVNDEDGDLAILAVAHRLVAGALDREEFAVVSRRVDARAVARDAASERKGGVNAGTKIVSKGKTDATIL